MENSEVNEADKENNEKKIDEKKDDDKNNGKNSGENSQDIIRQEITNIIDTKAKVNPSTEIEKVNAIEKKKKLKNHLEKK